MKKLFIVLSILSSSTTHAWYSHVPLEKLIQNYKKSYKNIELYRDQIEVTHAADWNIFFMSATWQYKCQSQVASNSTQKHTENLLKIMHQLLLKALKEGAAIGCLNAILCKALGVQRAPGVNILAVIALLLCQNRMQDTLPYYQPWDLEKKENFFDMANIPTAWRFMTAHFAAGVSETITKSILNKF